MYGRLCSSLGRAPADEYEGAGDQGEDFVVVALEVRRLDLLAEIPVGFPVAETQPDAAFATDGARMRSSKAAR